MRHEACGADDRSCHARGGTSWLHGAHWPATPARTIACPESPTTSICHRSSLSHPPPSAYLSHGSDLRQLHHAENCGCIIDKVLEIVSELVGGSFEVSCACSSFIQGPADQCRYHVAVMSHMTCCSHVVNVTNIASCNYHQLQLPPVATATCVSRCRVVRNHSSIVICRLHFRQCIILADFLFILHYSSCWTCRPDRY